MLSMRTLLRVAWRSIWRSRRRTAITVSAIAFGLSLAVFFLALAEGVYQQMIRDACTMQAGHITIEHASFRDAPAVDLVVDDVGKWRQIMGNLPGVVETKVLVTGQAVAKSAASAVGVTLVGVEPALERGESPLVKRITAGEYLGDSDMSQAVIGAMLAERLQLAIGKKMVIASNNVRGELVEELVRVRGIFKVGSPEVDGYLVQVPLRFSRRLFGMQPEQATQIGVVVADPAGRNAIMAKLRDAAAGAPQIAVLPWEVVMPELSAYVRLDRGSNQIFQAIIIFLSLFTIFNTILMSVLERTREFGVLLALGTPPAWLRTQVLLESAILGLLGVALGLGVGVAICYPLHVYGLDLSSLVNGDVSISGFAIDARVYPVVSRGLLVTLGAVVLAATLAIGVLSTRRLVRIRVADVLRHRG